VKKTVESPDPNQTPGVLGVDLSSIDMSKVTEEEATSEETKEMIASLLENDGKIETVDEGAQDDHAEDESGDQIVNESDDASDSEEDTDGADDESVATEEPQGDEFQSEEEPAEEIKRPPFSLPSAEKQRKSFNPRISQRVRSNDLGLTATEADDCLSLNKSWRGGVCVSQGNCACPFLGGHNSQCEIYRHPDTRPTGRDRLFRRRAR
jgi:hypothetical protein